MQVADPQDIGYYLVAPNHTVNDCIPCKQFLVSS